MPLPSLRYCRSRIYCKNSSARSPTQKKNGNQTLVNDDLIGQKSFCPERRCFSRHSCVSPINGADDPCQNGKDINCPSTFFHIPLKHISTEQCCLFHTSSPLSCHASSTIFITSASVRRFSLASATNCRTRSPVISCRILPNVSSS